MRDNAGFLVLGKSTAVINNNNKWIVHIRKTGTMTNFYFMILWEINWFKNENSNCCGWNWKMDVWKRIEMMEINCLTISLQKNINLVLINIYVLENFCFVQPNKANLIGRIEILKSSNIWRFSTLWIKTSNHKKSIIKMPQKHYVLNSELDHRSGPSIW